MTPLIIDTSVAAKWLFLEEGSDKAEALLGQLSFFFVPDLFLVEIDSVIAKKVRKNEITTDEALAINNKKRELPYIVVKYQDISRLTFEISISLPVTVYDATYVATAIEKQGLVYTADQRLINGLSNTSLSKYIRSIWDD